MSKKNIDEVTTEKETKAAKTTKSAKTEKNVEKDAKATKDKIAKDTKATKDAKTAKSAKSTKSTKEAKTEKNQKPAKKTKAEAEVKKTFTIIDKSGKEVKCEVVLILDIQEIEKSVVLYTDHSLNADGEPQIYASEVVTKEDGSTTFKDITSESDWAAVERALAELPDTVEE